MFRYEFAICRKKNAQGKMINNVKNASIWFALKMTPLYRNMPEIQP